MAGIPSFQMAPRSVQNSLKTVTLGQHGVSYPIDLADRMGVGKATKLSEAGIYDLTNVRFNNPLFLGHNFSNVVLGTRLGIPSGHLQKKALGLLFWKKEYPKLLFKNEDPKFVGEKIFETATVSDPQLILNENTVPKDLSFMEVVRTKGDHADTLLRILDLPELQVQSLGGTPKDYKNLLLQNKISPQKMNLSPDANAIIEALAGISQRLSLANKVANLGLSERFFLKDIIEKADISPKSLLEEYQKAMAKIKKSLSALRESGSLKEEEILLEVVLFHIGLNIRPTIVAIMEKRLKSFSNLFGSQLYVLWPIDYLNLVDGFSDIFQSIEIEQTELNARLQENQELQRSEKDLDF